MKKRKYNQKQRAVQQAQTRDRIVEAAMHLHENLGPANTTISAIAKRAGVQRLTVYRHFEDDNAIFQACSSRWLELNPPPDPEAWREIIPAGKQTQRALQALYGYYREKASMLHGVHHDEHEVPALERAMKVFRAYLDGIRDMLLGTWKPARSRRRKTKALIAHALRFPTWQSLQEEGLKDGEIASLMTRSIEAAVNG